MKHFAIKLRVYYEDTDAGGVVYYANYLKFYERCRTEYLRSLGFEQDQLLADFAILFVVKKVSIDYLAPARFNDELIVTAKVTKRSKASLVFEQTIEQAKDNKVINRAEVVVVCVNRQFRPAPIPQAISFRETE